MKILNDVEAQVGRWAIAGVAIVLVVMLLIVHFVWHRRSPVQPAVPLGQAPAVPGAATPGEPPTPPPAVAAAQSTSATTTHVHIVIRRWPRQWAAPGPGGGRLAQAAGQAAQGGVPEGSTSIASSAIATDSPPIEIEVTTTSTASSTAAATASAPSLVAALPPAQSGAPSHGRIGVLAATVPGVLAVDVEALQLRTPWWLVGQPIEVGLDAQANLAEAGAGISVGSKAFAEAGGYFGFNEPRRGVYVGGGLRF